MGSIPEQGIGFNVALREPHGESSTAREQLATAMAACFGLQLLMHPAHVGYAQYYGLTILRRHTGRTLCITARVLIIAGMAAAANISLPGWTAWQFCALQAALAGVQALLLQVQLMRYGTAQEQVCAGVHDGAEETLTLDDAEDQQSGDGPPQPTRTASMPACARLASSTGSVNGARAAREPLPTI